MTVKVKPLVWENFDAWTYWAKCAVGTYRAQERNGVWKAILDRKDNVDLIYEYTTDGLTPNDFEAAQIAAQADYEARILAAIEVPDHLALVAAAYRDAAAWLLDMRAVDDDGNETTPEADVYVTLINSLPKRTPADAEAHLTALLRAEYERGKAETQQSLGDAVKETIVGVLRHYRQNEVSDEYGYGYPLVDALTLEGHGIDMGIREIENIADAVAHAILTQEGR